LYKSNNICIRASIIAGCKPAECLGGGKRRGERRKAGYKLIADLDTGTEKLCERDK
jgi:hypothetical protein